MCFFYSFFMLFTRNNQITQVWHKTFLERKIIYRNVFSNFYFQE